MYAKATDLNGNVDRHPFFLEVCGTEILTVTTGIEKHVGFKGDDSGLKTYSASYLASLFTITHLGISPSQCGFTTSSLVDITQSAAYAGSEISLNTLVTQIVNMKQMDVSTANGFTTQNFFLKYETLGKIMAYKEFEIEICGYETLACNAPSSFIKPKDTTTLILDTALLHSYFVLTSGPNCGYKSFSLFSDAACTIPWSNSAVASLDTASPIDNKMYPLVLSQQNVVSTSVFIKGETVGSIWCGYQVIFEVCDSITPSSATIDEIYLLNQNTTAVYVEVSSFFSAATPNCYQQNKGIEVWD